ncbi:MAG: WG repeat-containing protein, partial [Schleiferiaceae bacterium]|nr:WG repeat-containing protein [Schleiferiaceae bacterium]
MTRFFLPLLSSFFLLSCSSNGQQNADVFTQFQLSDAELKNYLAAVKVDGKFGIANALGEMVLPAEYENRPQRIMWDKVVVYNDSGYGLVSLENELLMPMNQRGISYAEGFRKEDCFFSIRKSNTTFDFVDLDLNPLESAEWYNTRKTLYYDYNNLHSKGPVTFQIKNLKKEEQLSFKDEEFLCWIGPFNEGMAPIYLTKHAGVKYSSEEPIYYGFINEKGKLAIPIQYKMVDQYRAQGNHVEDYNRLRFEDGKALIWTRGAYFMINAKGDTVHAFDENVDAVYPVLKEGTRMLSIVKNTERGRKKEKILVDREYNEFYQNGQDGWEYTLKGIGLSEFNESGYTIQHHREKKEFR